MTSPIGKVSNKPQTHPIRARTDPGPTRPNPDMDYKSVVLHLLDGMGQIQGATTSATAYELSKTPITYMISTIGKVSNKPQTHPGSMARWLPRWRDQLLDRDMARWLDANGGCLQP